MANLLRAKYPFIEPAAVIDQLVIGSGVVGLAIARKLAALTDRTTFLVER